jgi:hypothetical protein
MQTVADITTARKPSTAYYAHLHDQAGALVQVNGALTFVGEDGAIVDVEPRDVNFLVVLGQMQMSDAQRIADLMAGGYAGVACSRMEGVA